MKKIIRHDGMNICPICKREFLHNSMSIYKLEKNNKIRYYCSYTCWRKDGGDSGRVKRR
jgi:hypothetical protein